MTACPDCGEEILCHCGEDERAHDGLAGDGASPPLGHTFVPWWHDGGCERDECETEPSAAEEYEDRRDHERAHSASRLG